MVRWGLFILCAVLGSGCADIRFERGPYVVRDLEVVYSEQEQTTFISWRLRKDAKVRLVDFELWRDDAYRPIDLADAPFAAEPYRCGEMWCFQYQLYGTWELPTDGSPVRSVHRRDGVFMGAAPRVSRVLRSFDADPIALGHNDAIDPRRYDWFAENGIPLRRSYEWQFSANCTSAPDAWQLATEPIPVDRVWTANPACFHLRPRRADNASPEVARPLQPSAETTFGVQTYQPPREETPIVWGMLLDLHIRDASRCTQVTNKLTAMVRSSINARGATTEVGIFTPVDAQTGEPLSGCDQAANREYPLEQMLSDAEHARSLFRPDDVRVLWVLANNIDLPPSPRILDQLYTFGSIIAGDGYDYFDDDFFDDDFLEDDEVGGASYAWAIGSSAFLGVLPWDVQTPWRPVEDETFSADIKSTAQLTLPFTTMLHDEWTEIPIDRPDGLTERPKHVKICQATPFPVSLWWSTSYGSPGDTLDWPEFDDVAPHYFLPIPEQHLVPFGAYVRHTQDVVVEVCTNFCAGPFRAGTTDFASWQNTPSCQWFQ